MPLFQSSGLYSAEPGTPEDHHLATHGDASLGKQIFNMTMAEIESVAEANGVADCVWRESVTLVRIYAPILAVPEQ